MDGGMKVAEVLNFKVEGGEKLYYVKYQPVWIKEEDPTLDESVVKSFWDVIHHSYEILEKHFQAMSPPPIKRDGEGNPAHIETVDNKVSMDTSMSGVIKKAPPTTPKKGRGRGRGTKIVTFDNAINTANTNGNTPVKSKLNIPTASNMQQIYPSVPTIEIKLPIHDIKDVAMSPLDMDDTQLDLNMNPLDLNAATPKKEGNFNDVISPIKMEPMSPKKMTPVKSPTLKSPRTKSPKKEITAESWENPHVNIQYYCRYCEVPCETLQRRSIKSHYESHFALKNIGCYQCNMRFRTKGEAKSHIVRDHKIPYQMERLLQYHDKVEVPIIPIDEHGENIFVSPYVSHFFKCKICACSLPRNAEHEWKKHYESHSVAQ